MHTVADSAVKVKVNSKKCSKKLGRLRSTIVRSLLNLLSIRPLGVSSNHDTGACMSRFRQSP